MMRKSCLAVLLMLASLFASAPASAALIGPASAVSVDETIADLGGGIWEYSYNFQNTDLSAMWHFIVFTDFATFGSTATFPSSAPTSLSVAGVATPYDARNIDPGLTDLTNMWYTPFGGPNALGAGGFGTFTFQANVLDTGAKLFAYETVNSGYAGGSVSGQVAGIGYTSSEVPEPASVTLLGAGLAALIARRRRASKS